MGLFYILHLQMIDRDSVQGRILAPILVDWWDWGRVSRDTSDTIARSGIIEGRKQH